MSYLDEMERLENDLASLLVALRSEGVPFTLSDTVRRAARLMHDAQGEMEAHLDDCEFYGREGVNK